MKAVERMGSIDEQGQLSLDNPLEVGHHSRVRVIVLIPDEECEDEGFNSESFQKSWEQAITGQTLPLSQLWQKMDVK